MLLTAVACSPEEAAVAPTPEVVLVGCEALLEGPVCVVEPGKELTWWVLAPREARLELEWEGVRRDPGWEFVEDGQRGVFTPERPEGALTLRDVHLGWRWSVALRPAVALAAAPSAALAVARAARAEGHHDAALAVLDASEPLLRGSARVQALALRAAVHHASEDFDAALADYERAFALAVTHRLDRTASRFAGAAAFICIERRPDPACAQRWLERHAALGLPEARIEGDFLRGLWASREADWRRAIAHYTEYTRRARALGLTTSLAAGLLELGASYSLLGDSARSKALYREMLALPGLSPANAARAQQSAAYLELEARIRGEPSEDPAPALRAALEIFEGDAPSPTDAAETRINLVLAEFVAGDLKAARAVASALIPRNPQQARWGELLLGRLELAEGDAAAALLRLDRLAAAAEDAGDRARAWDAAVYAGEALERLGDDEAALRRYRRAAELHARRLAAVSEGREVYAADGDRGARRLVGLLVRLGRLDEALCAARWARARPFAVAAAVVRDPDELRDYHRERRALDAELERAWTLRRPARAQRMAELRAGVARLERRLDDLLLGQLPAESTAAELDACIPPAPGVVMLVFYPGERGYFAFAQDASGVLGVELDSELPTDASERAVRLLDPFAAKLEGATRIEVLASGTLTREAFHALPWRGRALIEHAPVVYRLDLPRPVVATAPRRVLQLVPESNLAGASAEVRAAARVLGERGLSVTERRGDEADLRQQLRVDILHYVGHAHAEGWDSALELGGDRRLSARELLAGPAPTFAVLGGCETGLPDPRAHGGGISLAHALLLAGSAAVIGTSSTIRDDLAASLVPLLLAALADGADPAEALRRAQLRHLDSVGWERFRAYAP